MFRRSLLAGLVVCMLAAMWPPASAQAEEGGATIYVSPDGSDSNSGAENDPLRTLEGARDAIRALKSDGGLPAGGVTVLLREGTYERLDTFELTAEDSGTAEAPIVYRSYPGETVRLSGGAALSRDSFVPVDDSEVLRRIVDEGARGRVLQVDLRSLGIEDYGEMSRHGYWKANDVSLVPPMELYVGGQGMTLARWPNDATVQMGDILDPGPTVNDPDLQERGGTFRYAYDRPKYWTEAEDIWLDGIFGYSWEWSYNKVASIDTANKTITLQYGEMSGLLKNWYPDFHFAQNLLEEIDAPGEYYIDRNAGILYFLPNAAFASGHGEVVVTMLKKPMIRTVNASYIRFEALALEYGRDTAAVILGGENVVIANSDISNFTNGGVLINSPGRYVYDGVEGDLFGREHAVVSTHLHHIGGTAVTLNGGDRTTLEPGNNRVENSHIHDFAYYHKAYNPGVLFFGVGHRASGNEIHDAPHPGIIVYGNDHVIEYNEIYDICKDFQDLGAIYMNAGMVPHERGNVVYRNYFHHIGEDKHGVEGVYPDNMTMGMRIEENIFYRMGNDAIKSGTGSYITATNNMFIDTYVPYDNYEMFMSREPGNRVDRDYMPAWQALFEQYNDFVGTPYLEKYPELATFFEEDRYFPTTNRFANNVIYNPTLARSAQTNEHGARDIHNLLQYENNWVASADPGFVDAAAGDFRLVEGAEVFERVPGFREIPFEQIGTQGKVGIPHAPDAIGVAGVYLGEELVVEVGKTAAAGAEVVPWNATNRSVRYTVDDPTVAEVDADGNVTGVSPGVTVLTAASAEDPSIADTAVVTVIEGDGVLSFTDFESGGGGWLVDANHSIEEDETGNHWYRIVDGANSQTSKLFSNYALEYKLRTPETFEPGASFLMYERNGANGSGYVQYKDTADGSVWTLFDSQWRTLKAVSSSEKDLLPGSVHDVKMIVRGADVSVFVDGRLRLQGEHPSHSQSGKVGFYVEGFTHLQFDDIRISLPTQNVEAVVVEPDVVRLPEGGQTLLRASVLPENASNRAVTWTTSDADVASVDEDGFVTAVGRGEAVVTARSAANPDVFATATVVVSDVLHVTDFENGGGGWLVDANHDIVADGDGNRWYRIANGANAKSPIELSDYVLTYRLKTPDSIPDGARLVMYERDGANGSGYVIYKNTAEGSSWSIADAEWRTLAEAALAGDDLAPGTTYEVKLVGNGSNIRLYVNGELRLEGEHPAHSAAGKVGFYVEGFPDLQFDDIAFSIVRVSVTGIELDRSAVTMEEGESAKLTATVAPHDATTKRVGWSSSDPGVVSVADDGTLKAHGAGTATVTVVSKENADIRAEAVVTVVEPSYPWVRLDDALNDGEHWTVSDAVYAADGTVTMTGNGVYGYGGAAFGSELLRFKADFDAFDGGWYGFAVRSDRVGDPTWVNGNKGYLIVIKEQQIELQSWKPGQTMISIIPNEHVFAGAEHDIEIGAVATDSGVRYLFRVDGDTVFNFLDTDAANPIGSTGYLNVYHYAGANNAIVLKPTRTIASIRTDAERYELAEGESKPAAVEVVYSDGTVEPATAADGVVFATEHPDVAAVDAAGVLTGVSRGETRLFVSYRGATAEAAVIVEKGKGKPDKPEKPDKPGKPEKPGKPDR
ncbi:hypothetical protein FE782_27785 [Paenibacillus antri]|uniref:BIG2 domain-containing protein n=1 Tax=Paenibacillus antri TaxID=2582848 RepID=A0A5R9G869_9BACL|nr:Ig-like domain-containing protein [Paenibacillus antri]TLS48943.1 hypothetical protein FE782_27785 [Paenibacillus antri]